MTDLVVRTYLQELTAAFLENGFADIRDKRKENQVRICPFSKRAFAYQQHIPQEHQTENETGKDTFSD